MYQGKAWIPLRFMAEAFGAPITYKAPQRREVRISAYEKKELGDLFDIMSTAWYGGYFRDGNVKNEDLIVSAYFGCRGLPSSKFIGDTHITCIVNAKMIEQWVYKYFHKKVRHQSIDTGMATSFVYSRGYYYVRGDGDPGMAAKAAFKLLSLGNNYYQAYATYYDDDYKRIFGKDQIRLKKVTTNGKSRFIIIDYLPG